MSKEKLKLWKEIKKVKYIGWREKFFTVHKIYNVYGIYLETGLLRYLIKNDRDILVNCRLDQFEIVE